MSIWRPAIHCLKWNHKALLNSAESQNTKGENISSFYVFTNIYTIFFWTTWTEGQLKTIPRKVYWKYSSPTCIAAYLKHSMMLLWFPFIINSYQLIRISWQTDQVFRFIHGFDRTVRKPRNRNTFETIWMRTLVASKWPVYNVNLFGRGIFTSRLPPLNLHSWFWWNGHSQLLWCLTFGKEGKSYYCGLVLCYCCVSIINWSIENGWPTETFPYYIFQSQIIYKAGLKRYK